MDFLEKRVLNMKSGNVATHSTLLNVNLNFAKTLFFGNVASLQRKTMTKIVY
jgi:hypothetical protein